MILQLGVNVPNFGPGTSPESLERWAQTAERLGFGLLMVSDHVAVTADVAERYPAPFYDPFTTLAWLAGRTDQIKLGTTVLVMPYRHPLLTASMAGTLDRLTGGRLVLGVGVGWARQEFAALGVPYHRRGAITDDYLAALRAAWVSDGPIWVGGNSEAAMRRAVRFADAWHPLGFTMAWLPAALSRLAGLAAAEGRAVPGFAPRLRVSLTSRPVAGDDRQAGHGTLAQVTDDVAELAERGAHTVVLDTYTGDPDQTLRPERDWDTLAALLDELEERLP
ncbi:MAG TPA: LLM class flavin-dependent oxidoreductase [Streptosporangiaceae bacterium]